MGFPGNLFASTRSDFTPKGFDTIRVQARCGSRQSQLRFVSWELRQSADNINCNAQHWQFGNRLRRVGRNWALNGFPWLFCQHLLAIAFPFNVSFRATSLRWNQKGIQREANHLFGSPVLRKTQMLSTCSEWSALIGKLGEACSLIARLLTYAAAMVQPAHLKLMWVCL